MPDFDKELIELDERKAWFLPLVVEYLQQRLVKMGPAIPRACQGYGHRLLNGRNHWLGDVASRSFHALGRSPGHYAGDH